MSKIPSQTLIESCPICNSKNINDLNIDETYFLRPFEETMIAKLGSCSDCNFIFHLQPLDDESMKKYYEKNFQLRSLDIDLVEEHVHAKQAKFISNYKSLENKKILEIGANTGRFLNHLKILHGCKTFFDEYNFEAKNLLENIQGHKSYEELQNNEKFDVIIMRHVLEHVVNPISYLSKLQEKLSDNGILFIEVPDFSYIDDKTDTLLFEHVNYFSQLTMSKALDAAGYVVVSQEFSITDNYATCSDRVLRVLAEKKPHDLKKGIPSALQNHQFERVGKTNALIEKLCSDLESDAKIAFYSASWWTERVLLNAKIAKNSIVGIFDKDKKKHGNIFHGVKVIPPTEISELQPDIIFVLTSFEHQIKHDLKMLNYQGKVIGWSDLLRMIEK